MTDIFPIPPPFLPAGLNLISVVNTITTGAAGMGTVLQKFKPGVLANVGSKTNVQIVIETGGVTTFTAVWIGLVDADGGIKYNGGQKRFTFGGQYALVTKAGVNLYESDLLPFGALWRGKRDLMIGFDVAAGGIWRYRTGLSKKNYFSYFRAGVAHAGLTSHSPKKFSESAGMSRFIRQIRVL